MVSVVVVAVALVADTSIVVVAFSFVVAFVADAVFVVVFASFAVFVSLLLFVLLTEIFFLHERVAFLSFAVCLL